MLTHIILSLCLIILEIIIFQFRFLPLHGKDLVAKIRIVPINLIGYVFHQVSKLLSDILKLIDSRVFHVVRVQNLFNEFLLRHNLRNIRCDTSYRRHLFHQIVFGAVVCFASKIGELNPIHQRSEPKRLGVILLRQDQWGQFFTNSQSIAIRERIVIIAI